MLTFMFRLSNYLDYTEKGCITMYVHMYVCVFTTYVLQHSLAIVTKHYHYSSHYL